MRQHRLPRGHAQADLRGAGQLQKTLEIQPFVVQAKQVFIGPHGHIGLALHHAGDRLAPRFVRQPDHRQALLAEIPQLLGQGQRQVVQAQTGRQGHCEPMRGG